LISAAEKYSKEEIKGEIVLIIEGNSETAKEKMTLDDAVKYALDLVENGESKTNAAKEAAKESGFKKGEIYKEII